MKIRMLFFIPLIIFSLENSGMPDNDGILIENFEGKLFGSWLVRDASNKKASGTYKIMGEEGNRFLRAESRKNSIQIAKKISWDLKKYPVLSWRWRVLSLPPGANEEKRGKNDSAAAVYVIFQRKKIPLVSWKYQPINVLKYIWSASLPVGRVVRKEKTKLGTIIYLGRFMVLESGSSKKGQWINESRNVINDYKKAFGEAPEKNPILIAILTDSNDTGSSAISDYDDIVIKRK